MPWEQKLSYSLQHFRVKEPQQRDDTESFKRKPKHKTIQSDAFDRIRYLKKFRNFSVWDNFEIIKIVVCAVTFSNIMCLFL